MKVIAYSIRNFFFFSSRRRHTRWNCDWSSDVCSSDLGYRFGMPFFLPVAYYDTRVQLLDNISIAKGAHLFKLGGEYNRVNSVQTFIGFANSRYIFSSVNGFLNYVANANYVECPNGSSNTTGGSTPCGTTAGGAPILPSGPVLLYLQQAGVNRSVR